MVKKSKSIALDNRDLNPLFSMMKGYGPLMALGIIAVLSVCAAFFIYRSTKNQSKENGEKEEEEEEEDLELTQKNVENEVEESTGTLDDEKANPVESCDPLPDLCSVKNDCVSLGVCKELQGNGSPDTRQPPENSEEPREEPLATATDPTTGRACAPQPSCSDSSDQQNLEDGLRACKEESSGDAELRSHRLNDENQEKSAIGDKGHTFVDETWEDLSGHFGKACLKVDPGDGQEMCVPLSSADCQREVSEYEVKDCKAEECEGAYIAEHYCQDDQQNDHDQLSQQESQEDVSRDKRTGKLMWPTTCPSIELVQYPEEVKLIPHYETEACSFALHNVPYKSGESTVMSTGGLSVMLATPAQKQASSSGEIEEMEDLRDKTEINIMEATMDNNEWLSSGEQQSDFPWMNLGRQEAPRPLVDEELQTTEAQEEPHLPTKPPAEEEPKVPSNKAEEEPQRPTKLPKEELPKEEPQPLPEEEPQPQTKPLAEEPPLPSNKADKEPQPAAKEPQVPSKTAEEEPQPAAEEEPQPAAEEEPQPPSMKAKEEPQLPAEEETLAQSTEAKEEPQLPSKRAAKEEPQLSAEELAARMKAEEEPRLPAKEETLAQSMEAEEEPQLPSKRAAKEEPQSPAKDEPQPSAEELAPRMKAEVEPQLPAKEEPQAKSTEAEEEPQLPSKELPQLSSTEVAEEPQPAAKEEPQLSTEPAEEPQELPSEEESKPFMDTSVPYAVDEDPAMKLVATVPPMLQNVHVTFCVHYITSAPNQRLAVTGNHPDLGSWQDFVPLQRGKNGFWLNTVPLPLESQLEWKFVLVEDGAICRWEECSNRHLMLTLQEETVHVQRWWGFL